LPQSTPPPPNEKLQTRQRRKQKKKLLAFFILFIVIISDFLVFYYIFISDSFYFYIIIIIIDFHTSQLWLRNIHLSWDAGINRLRLGGLICSLESFLQLNMCQELQIFAAVYIYWGAS